MSTQRPNVRKKVIKNEYTPKIEQNKTMRGFSGEIQAVLFFAFSIMILVSLLTFDVADNGVNNKTMTGVINNALGRGGALFSAFIIEAFGAASFVLPLLLFSFGVVKIRGQSVSIYKIFGILFVLVLCALLSASTNFVVQEEKAGGFIGSFLYNFMLGWVGSIGITIVLWCFIPICVKLLFNVSVIGVFYSLLQSIFSGIKRLFSALFGKLRLLVFKKKMARLYETKVSEELPFDVEEIVFDNKEGETKKEEHKQEFSVKAMLGRYLGIKMEDSKSEAVFDDLMNLSQYDAEHNSVKMPKLSTDIPKKESKSISKNEAIFSTEEIFEDRNLERKALVSDTIKEKESIVIEEETVLPNVGLLGAIPKVVISAEEKKRIQEIGDKIIACLDEFKVKADLVGYTPGPVITQYEIRPHAGVRVSKVKNLGDDLALKLEAISVRVQAPIPETDLIGIEVPNKKRQTVYFQELINSKAFEKQQSFLTMALGKTTAGNPFFADLAQMPHLLIAGSTGAGKSVCLNSIILSILYKASPKDVQLLLIDPKRVELQAYQDLPHLVHPVVTQMDLARSALQWAVEEMERRYSSMERMGSKDILDYNAKIRRILASHSERADVLKEFPYLVILIDELADLILTATKEVETNLTRLSQLARACGIHLILATQRPSVDVVTALIKANFPSRIAFRVTSRHDSGTILDTIGAEKLLGKGDMLFKTTQIQRIHGAFVSTDEVEAVVDYWKSKERLRYTVDFAQWQVEKSVQTPSAGLFADENDPQYQEAVQFVYERGEASISAIQRRFRIGFNKAARYVEQMEQNGILENVGGMKRKVIRT